MATKSDFLHRTLKSPCALANQLGDGHANEATTMTTTLCPPKQQPWAMDCHALDPNPGIQRKMHDNETSASTSTSEAGQRGDDGWLLQTEEHNDVNWVNKRLESEGICGLRSQVGGRRWLDEWRINQAAAISHCRLHNTIILPTAGGYSHSTDASYIYIHIRICVSCVREQQENGGKIVASSTRTQTQIHASTR